ncbi:uncharacterized protein LOC108027537 [Drosophila biarmipes]|uniref:uncharacterized protein LOC108027537 n=1 Tax=Drosophila biarmipes TaxID=125945 RepID=UPI0007E75F40|nr:uncharacterized protein LOC108027537 [Drosophila biarmipes]
MMVVQSVVVLWIFMITTCLGAEDCLKLHNLTSAQVEAVDPSTAVSHVPLAVKCYSRCAIDGYFGDDGKIDLQRVGNRGTKEEHAILAQCKQRFDDATDLGRCDYPYLMLQCLFSARASGTSGS